MPVHDVCYRDRAKCGDVWSDGTLWHQRSTRIRLRVTLFRILHYPSRNSQWCLVDDRNARPLKRRGSRSVLCEPNAVRLRLALTVV